MKILINPAYRQLEAFVQEVPDRFSREGTLIFQGRNQLKRFVVQGEKLIVKSFRPPHVLNRVVYATIRPSKAYRSFTYGLELCKRGISTAVPIACIEEFHRGLVRSFYITEEIEEVREMRDFGTGERVEKQEEILAAFGKFTADMHKKQVLHKDYSAGNILYGMRNGQPVFFLVDINRVRFDRPVGEEEGYKSFDRLWLTDEAYTLIARSYAEAMGYDQAHAVEQVRRYKNLFMRNRR